MTNRHLGLVFRGTGGVIGQDYVSRVLQAVSDLVEEVHPEFTATMGGLPVGAAGDINDPSMSNACEVAFEDAKSIFLSRYHYNPKIKVVIGGYSAGAVAAAMFREWLLTFYPDNYLCSFSIGDPTRPKGGAFFAGKPTAGQGISSWRYGDITDWRHCWLAAPGDMYTSVPLGDTGRIMSDFYDIVTKLELSDPLGTLEAILSKVPDLLTHTGILSAGTGHPVQSQSLSVVTEGLDGLLQGGLKTGFLTGLIGGKKDPLTSLITGLLSLATEPQGIGAAINAAIEGLRFISDTPPTAAHIQYEFREVWRGQTYLGLAIQHVRDWASRVPLT